MKNTWILICLLIAFSFVACKDSVEEENDGPPKIRVFLTDGPANLEEVNIDIMDVQINPMDESGGWRSLASVSTGVYDLLDLTGGAEMLLGEAEIPEGRLQQIRLILGENNSLKVDGQTKALNTPSAQESGLKVQIKQDLQPGITYKLLLDFDAGQSIVEAGNSGNFQLKPVLRASLEALSGSIQGKVEPSTYQMLITATSATETISSYTDESGFFLLRGVPEGTYQLLITPDENSGFEEKTVNNVEVKINQSTDVGTIIFME